MKLLTLCLLPLVLSASLDARSLRLRWADTSNTEQGFVIERSTDGVTFTEVHRTGPDVTMWVDTTAEPLVPYWYRVEAFNQGGRSGFTPVQRGILRGEVINVSTRGFVGTDDQVMIVGFVVHLDPARVLIRSVGPGLAQFGVPKTLEDPMFVVNRMESSGAVEIAANDNWEDGGQGATVAEAARATSAFALQPNSADAALVMVLAPGQYTIVCRGKDAGTGVALGEVYSVP